MSPTFSHLLAAATGALTVLAVLTPYMAHLRRAKRTSDYEANHDSLTGLANRRGLTRRLRNLLAASRPVGVILLDLNGFKRVNDTPAVGHAGGDDLLRHVARILAALPPPALLAARFGGDEFVVLVDGDLTTTGQIADELAWTINGAPIRIAGHQFPITASVGYTASRPGQTVRRLLREADLAMFDAKRIDRGRRVVAWPPDDDEPAIADRPHRRIRDC
ncbi:GGDEF domain-containing protein [Phytohabitans kaempferiae]|uniref:GGDEF domain-containing protein n=1 Tax=Phytohabitans kaempferiae TaxID=1620943 RepID=A0ABV6MCB7_9ACTN